jgi:hypothetical protein
MEETMKTKMKLADALVRLETLPYAFSSQKEGKQWRVDWTKRPECRAGILETLNVEVYTHKQCGNYVKASYIQEVLTALRKG